MITNKIPLYISMVWHSNFHHSCERRQSYRFQNLVLTYVGLKFGKMKVLFQGKQCCTKLFVWVFVWYFIGNSCFKVDLKEDAKTPCFHRRSKSLTSPLWVSKKSFRNNFIQINAINIPCILQDATQSKRDTLVAIQSHNTKPKYMCVHEGVFTYTPISEFCTKAAIIKKT